MEALLSVGLYELHHESVHRLSYGQQRLLELACAIVAKPRVLLLDEPAAGLSAQESNGLAARIRKLQHQGMAIILVEHKMSFVMSLCQSISVLDFGKLIANGSPSEIQRNEQVIEAYLGTAVRQDTRHADR